MRIIRERDCNYDPGDNWIIMPLSKPPAEPSGSPQPSLARNKPESPSSARFGRFSRGAPNPSDLVKKAQIRLPRSRRRLNDPADNVNVPKPIKPEPSRTNVPGSGTVVPRIDNIIESLPPWQPVFSLVSLQILV